MTTTTTAAPPPRQVTTATWMALVVILLGEIVDMLDSLVTTVAGPSILRDLGGGSSALQWLSVAYTLAMAGGLLIGGRLGDRFGRKHLFLFGMAGFTAMSVLAAVATDIHALLAIRAFQGLLGALMLPQGLGMIRELFPKERVGEAFGLFGPLMGLSAVAGPILGGWLVDADIHGWGWRMIFAINIPLGLLALVAGARLLPTARPDRSIGIDALGTFLAVGALVAVVFPLVQGRELDWPWWCFALLTAGVLMLAAFAVHQSHREAAGRSTLVVPSLFRKRAFSAGLVVGLFFFGGFTGSSLVLAVLFQVGLGMTPFASAIAMMPMAVGMIGGFVLSQKLGTRRSTMLVGMVIAMVAQVGAAALLAWRGVAIGPWWTAPFLLCMGIGAGTGMGPFFDMVMSGVDDHEAGSASGAMTATQQVGGAFGIAVLGTVLFTVAQHAGTSLLGIVHGSAWAYVTAAVLGLASAVCTRLLPAVGTAHEEG